MHSASLPSTLLTFLFSRKLCSEPETGGPPGQGSLRHEATQEAGGADPSYWQGRLQPGLRGPQPRQPPTPVLREHALPPAAEILSAAAAFRVHSICRLGSFPNPGRWDTGPREREREERAFQAPSTAPCQKENVCVPVMCFL